MRGLALAVLLSAAPCGAAEPILGFNYPVWWHDAYASASSLSAYPAMAGYQAGWVAIIPSLYTKDRHDPEILATDATASDGSLRLAIRAAKSRGLKVLLKPHVDSRDGLPRAAMSPSDPARWFALYRVHLLRYARLAAEEKCEMFAVGTELSLLTLPNHWTQWRSLIRDVRAVYSGPLTYAANWHSVAHAGFWGDLDYIGVDGYYPVPGGANRRALEAAWKPWVAGLAALSKLYGRPVLFTEVGLASQRGANLEPWKWQLTEPLDLEVQAAYLDAFWTSFSGQPWFSGFLYWAWEADPARTGPNDRSMSVQGKPAEAVLRRAFASAKPAAALPRDNWLRRFEAMSLRLAGVRF